MRNLPAQYKIGSLARALSIIDAIADAGEVTLTDLSERLAIPKGSVLRHLRVLEAAGYVMSEPRKKSYSLGPALIHLGYEARRRLRVTDVAGPAINWLRDTYEESVHVGIVAGDDVVHVAVAASFQPIKMAVPVGHRTFFHASALGKCLLAWEDPEYVDELVARCGLPGLTPRTITEPSVWKRELELVRERGWSTDDEEAAPGLFCVAAPVRDESGKVIAAISISAPTTRLCRRDAEKLAPQLIDAANHVSAGLGWHERDGRRTPTGPPPWSATRTPAHAAGASK